MGMVLPGLAAPPPHPCSHPALSSPGGDGPLSRRDGAPRGTRGDPGGCTRGQTRAPNPEV
eukprot:scaffold2161_cov225-Prasinococcus_capsulatus_cf.AAC.4